MDGIWDRQRDKQTDDPITRCPRWTFQAWGLKTYFKQRIYSVYIMCNCDTIKMFQNVIDIHVY